MSRALGLALAGFGILSAAPAALAGDDPTLQDRIQELEAQVRELRDQLGSKEETKAEPLSLQVDRYLQEAEKGSLWTDKSGKPLGKVLDSIWVSMWMRARPTWSDNTTDLEDDTDDEGSQTFFRGKIGVGAKMKDAVSMYLEFDYAGTWGNTASVFANDTLTGANVQQAYVDGIYSKHLRMDTRVGRFEMQYGDEYVFGVTEFAQASVYHDGIKIGRDYEKMSMKFDAWAVKLVDGAKNPLTPTPDDSMYMFGVYGNWYGFQGKTGMPGGFEPYYVWLRDAREAPGVAGAAQPYDTHTGGVRWYGDKATKDKAGIGWNANGNVQYFRGWNWSTDDRVTYSMSNVKMKPQVFGQFAYASGNRDRGFGYNPLFQDVHGRYGWADMFTFTNLVVIGGGAKVSPSEGWTAGAEIRSIHQARSTVVESSKQIAWEGDLVATHKYSDNVDVELAYSLVLWRGIDNPAGNSADNTQRAYVQLVVSF